MVPASQPQSSLPRDLPLTGALGTATGLQASRQSVQLQVGFNIYPPGFCSGGSNHYVTLESLETCTRAPKAVTVSPTGIGPVYPIFRVLYLEQRAKLQNSWRA